MGIRPAMPVGIGGGQDRTPEELTIAPGVVISSALCAYLEGPQAVIVADTHLGMEAAADMLDSRTRVALTKGNHDNYLKNILPDEPLPRWTQVGDCLVCHGHQDLPRLGRFKGLKVLAHEHPALKLRDPVGAVVSAPAFVYDEASRTLVIPALGPLAFDGLRDRREPSGRHGTGLAHWRLSAFSPNA